MKRKGVSMAVKLLRVTRNLTQVDLSKKTKISQGKISKVEAGKLDLSVPEFCKILNVFGWDIKIGAIENEDT